MRNVERKNTAVQREREISISARRFFWIIKVTEKLAASQHDAEKPQVTS